MCRKFPRGRALVLDHVVHQALHVPLAPGIGMYGHRAHQAIVQLMSGNRLSHGQRRHHGADAPVLPGQVVTGGRVAIIGVGLGQQGFEVMRPMCLAEDVVGKIHDLCAIRRGSLDVFRVHKHAPLILHRKKSRSGFLRETRSG